MAYLTAELKTMVPSEHGPQADVIVTEPDGRSCIIRCLCRDDRTTELGGPQAAIEHLTAVWGSQVILSLLRDVVLRNWA